MLMSAYYEHECTIVFQVMTLHSTILLRTMSGIILLKYCHFFICDVIKCAAHTHPAPVPHRGHGYESPSLTPQPLRLQMHTVWSHQRYICFEPFLCHLELELGERERERTYVVIVWIWSCFTFKLGVDKPMRTESPPRASLWVPPWLVDSIRVHLDTPTTIGWTIGCTGYQVLGR
jgi:hypothetical protein